MQFYPPPPPPNLSSTTHQNNLCEFDNQYAQSVALLTFGHIDYNERFFIRIIQLFLQFYYHHKIIHLAMPILPAHQSLGLTKPTRGDCPVFVR